MAPLPRRRRKGKRGRSYALLAERLGMVRSTMTLGGSTARAQSSRLARWSLLTLVRFGSGFCALCLVWSRSCCVREFRGDQHVK